MRTLTHDELLVLVLIRHERSLWMGRDIDNAVEGLIRLGLIRRLPRYFELTPSGRKWLDLAVATPLPLVVDGEPHPYEQQNKETP